MVFSTFLLVEVWRYSLCEDILLLRLTSELVDLRKGYANSRPPVPEASDSYLLTTFVYFLVLFSPELVLFCAVIDTVSVQKNSVDGQRCGRYPNSNR